MSEETFGIRHVEDERDAIAKTLSLIEVEKMLLSTSVNRILESPVALSDKMHDNVFGVQKNQ